MNSDTEKFKYVCMHETSMNDDDSGEKRMYY